MSRAEIIGSVMAVVIGASYFFVMSEVASRALELKGAPWSALILLTTMLWGAIGLGQMVERNRSKKAKEE